MGAQSKIKPLTGPQLAGIHTLWKLIDAGRADERDARTARLDYCSVILGRPVPSAKDLSSDEAEKVLQAMRQEVGQEWKPRGASFGRLRRMAQNFSSARRAEALRHPKISGAEQTKLAEMAADLWGERWNALLEARLSDRFRVSGVSFLSPAQARSLVEELLQRLAVRNIADKHQPPITRAEIEAEKAVLRAKYFAGVEPGFSPADAALKGGATQAAQPSVGTAEQGQL